MIYYPRYTNFSSEESLNHKKGDHSIRKIVILELEYTKELCLANKGIEKCLTSEVN